MRRETVQPEQADRVIVGFCPDCKRVVVVMNNHETWPLVPCTCGWEGATTDISNRTRFVRGGERTP